MVGTTLTSLDEEILAMAEKVECHGFAANCSFAKQQKIIAIHINIGSVLNNFLFWQPERLKPAHTALLRMCEMSGKEHERDILRAGDI